MANRKEIDAKELEMIVGGKLCFDDGIVYPKDDPSAVYHYDDIVAVYNYISQNWPGGAYNEETLKMLERAGLVWK